MKYEVTEPGKMRKEMWDQKTVRVHSGGFNIDVNDFPRGVKYAEQGLALNINHSTRKATPVKTATVATAVGASATEVVVKKGHLFLVGDIIGTSAKSATISAIDTSDANTDTLTISAAIGAQAVGVVLQSSTEAGDNKALLDANGLNYADVALEGQPSVSAIYAADEVKLSKLPYPLTNAMQTSLTVRFLFIP